MEVFSLQDELTNLTATSAADYDFPNEVDIERMDSNEINATLNGVVDTITGDSSTIMEGEVFDTFRSLLKHSNHLNDTTLNKLLDAICSGFQSEIESTSRDNDPSDHTAYVSHKMALEMYAFLLQWFVVNAEKSAVSKAANDGALGPGGKKVSTRRSTLDPLARMERSTDPDELLSYAPQVKAKATKATKQRKDEFTWAASIPEALNVMSKALKLKTERIWQTTAERDTFVSSCFLKPVNLIAESEAYMKVMEIKLGVWKVICIAAKNHGQAFNIQMTIMQNLQYTEHLAEPMADLVTILAKEFDYSQLGEEVLREIAGKKFDAQDTKGPRSFSKFLIRLAETSPRLVLKQIALLQKHLDSESYPMRNAILEVIGLLIKELSTASGFDSDPEQQKRQLEAFFDLLFERFLDLNSYVRSKVAVVLLATCDLPTKFPKLRTRLTDLSIRSLEDKSSQVRKNCIALLTRLITTHPYGRMHGGELALSEWQTRYEGLQKELEPLDLPSPEEAAAMAEAAELMKDSDDEEGGVEKMEVVEEEDEVEDTEEEDAADGEDVEMEEGAEPVTPSKKKAKKLKPKARPRKSDGIDLAAADQSQLLANVDQDTLTRLRLTKKYYADAISFIGQLDRAMDTVADLLASLVKSEVLAAMEFFKVAYEYKIEAAEKGVKRMLHLIWSKDEVSTEEDGKEVKGVRSRLIECYSQLYFEKVNDLTEKEQVNRVARNVIELTNDATLAELTSLEALLGVMMAKGVVDDAVIAKLWMVYSSSKDLPRFQRRGAIIALGMFAAPKPEIVAEHVETLLRIGLGPYGRADLILAKYTCIALSRVSGSVKKVKGSLEDISVRLPMVSPVFERLQDIILHPSTKKEWFSMAEQAVNTIYGLGDQPDALCSSILRTMTMRIFGAKAEDNVQSAREGSPNTQRAGSVAPSDVDMDRQERESTSAPSQSPAMGNAFELSQLLFVAGHCAIKQLVHLELIERDIKRRKAEEEKKSGGKSATQDELEQVAGSTEDDIGEAIAESKENELLYGPGSLLAVYGPMAVTIVAQPKLYRNAMLKTAATLALSKFMCVSSKFCADNLMLLFKILETSREPAVRSNIVIALGDIAVCFSTIMDQNSERLYAGLQDKDLTVKKNTLMVLTHLILNGMIKGKGQLGEMAKCLVDEDKRISDLAHLFFTELSTKDRAIINNLPDIISHLSSGVTPVNEEMFAKSMRFIFTFVDKKKDAESLVDKLCKRFLVTTEPRQWRDITFCLSLLPFNSESAVKTLVEGLPMYRDKLYEETVFKRFNEILTKARNNKVSKNESDLKEFEDALEEYRAKGTEDQELQKKVAKNKRKTKAKPKRKVVDTPPSSPE